MQSLLTISIIEFYLDGFVIGRNESVEVEIDVNKRYEKGILRQ